MKNFIFALMIIAFIGNIALAQQEQPKAIKRISISDAYVQTGFLSQKNPVGTLTDFNKLAPQSVLLNNDFTGYASTDYSEYYYRGRISTNINMFSIMLGFKFSDKQKTAYKTNPQLRVGISYLSGTNLSGGLLKIESKPYDTLISTQTGNAVYVDSVTTNNYNMSYSTDQLRLDASLIYSTNPQARWSLFAGIGITAGLSVNAYTDISYYEYKCLEYDATTNWHSPYSDSFLHEEETYKNKNCLGVSAFVPMGVNFRIGKKREFWKQLNLFYELRPGINVTSIPELSRTTNASMQYGIGIRVSVD